MVQHIEAIYENGVLKPLTPLAAPEHARLQIDVIVEDAATRQSEGELSLAEFDQSIDELATDGPSVDSTFPRSEIYSDHD